jgi:hypothetical protein
MRRSEPQHFREQIVDPLHVLELPEHRDEGWNKPLAYTAVVS